MKSASLALAVAVGSFAIFASAAMAAHTTWVANPGTTYDNGVVTLDSTGQAAGTSYENLGVHVAVADGDEISFEYRGDCGGGAPRVFIQGGAYNTFDGNANQCGSDVDGDGWFLVTGTVTGVTAGEAGYTGIVNDNTSNPGVVEVRNLVIAGERVLLGNEPTSRDDCKDGGWSHLQRADGTAFLNQGDCIQYVNTGK